ncbi:hypothetical protein LEP1GSC137_1148 [Leptospira borgpetersenii str. Noumea 25]|nr:hypothetical protein LEP1GSC121_3576 [Leptospira borgpetersenii serovar Castellonis str. 200801910]EMO08027.1 hypothetical protein LEP1GSC137_1148 [Leptospira borgpetersenii str. Noumea 25]
MADENRSSTILESEGILEEQPTDKKMMNKIRPKTNGNRQE